MTDQRGRDKDSRADDHCKRACAPPAGLPTGNELTLARERQAKQSCAFFVVSGNHAWRALATGILRDLLTTTGFDHRNDEGRTDDNRIDELFDRRRSLRPRAPLRHRRRRAGAQRRRR